MLPASRAQTSSRHGGAGVLLRAPCGPATRSRRRPSRGGRSRARRSRAAAGRGWPGRRRPGISFLRARSPVTPKTTSAHGLRDPGQPAVARVAQRVAQPPVVGPPRRRSLPRRPAGARRVQQLGDAGRPVGQVQAQQRAVPRSARACRSPAAWAACSWPKVYGWPGTSRSSATAPVIWRNAPTCGPPLWYWPVECRNRGPQPKVTGRPVAAASAGAQLGGVGVGEPVEVGHDGEVAVLGPPRPAARPARRRRAAAEQAARSPYTSIAPSMKAGCLGAARAGLVQDLRWCCSFDSVHVGLVERVDAEHPAGHGGGVLPEQELRAERAVDRDAAVRGRRHVAGGRASHQERRPASGVGEAGRVGPSTTTGRMPVPFLPVDSAISCSAQSPKPTMPEPASAQHDLVAAGRGRPRPAPRRAAAPGLSSSAASVGGSASAWSSSSATSTPASAGGHQAERGQRAVAAADVRVGQEHRGSPHPRRAVAPAASRGR